MFDIRETQQPPFGPALPLLDGPELPSLRYPLGAEPAKTHPGGWSKEANVTNFPVSEKLAGVLMQLVPGGLRELHWHANAAEWAYVFSGHCRVTTIDPQNQSQVADFGPGDVWYFPRGHGHSIQGIGSEPCLFVLIFDNGYFSEFGTFSSSDWIAHTAPEVPARNFGVPAADLREFPEGRSLYCQGPGSSAAAERSGAGITRRESADAPPPHARATARSLCRWDDAHRVGERVPDLPDHHRRASHHQAGRFARASLAPACR